MCATLYFCPREKQNEQKYSSWRLGTKTVFTAQQYLNTVKYCISNGSQCEDITKQMAVTAVYYEKKYIYSTHVVFYQQW